MATLGTEVSTEASEPEARVTGASGPEASVADQLLGWDHLEWWVGNARAFSAWLVSGFGFEVTGYAGPETGVTDRVSYLVSQGDIRFVITAGLGADSEVARHVLVHGDGVRHLAWRVADATAATQAAARRGAVVVAEPTRVNGDAGAITTATIATYGTTRHLFVDRSEWASPAGSGGHQPSPAGSGGHQPSPAGSGGHQPSPAGSGGHQPSPAGWGPGWSASRLPRRPVGPATGLTSIDHVVGNVEQGRLDEWVSWYTDVLGFTQMRHFDADAISTQYSALRSTVVHNGAGIVLPINEPAPGLRQSQISEYLDAYGGPGVQHIALATRDIVSAVSAVRDRGVRFLDMPATYYEDAKVRCGGLDVPWSDLERLGIEVDTDAGGYLLQIFTETVVDRPTVFVELIQREGASGFGEGNFKALFEAIEREQARRGHL